MGDDVQKQILAKLTGMEHSLHTVQHDIQGLKQDVSDLKQDVSGLKQDVSGLKQDVSGLKQEQQFIKQAVLETNESVKRLEGIQEQQHHLIELLAARSLEQESALKQLKKASS